MTDTPPPSLSAWLLASGGLAHASSDRRRATLLAQAAVGLTRLRRESLPLDGKPAGHGFHVDAPLVTLLAAVATAPVLTPAIRCLCRHLLVAGRILQGRPPAQAAAARSALYGACLALRHLLNGTLPADLAEVLTNLPGINLREVRQQLSTHAGGDKQIEDIERLLAFGVGNRQPRARRLASPVGGADRPTPEQEASTARPSPAAIRQTGRHQPTDAILIDVDANAERTQRPRLSMRPTAGQRRALRRQSQGLVFARPDTLHAPDWEALVNALPSMPTAIRAVISAALHGGQSPQRLQQWRLASDAQDVDWTRAGTWLVLDSPRLLVCNRVNLALPRGEFGGLTADHVVLPLDLRCRGIAVLLGHARHRVGDTLFSSEEVEAARQALDHLRERSGTALSLVRLGKVVPQALRDITGDHSAGACLSGLPLDPHIAPRMHYAQRPLHDLATSYAAAVGAMLRKAFGDTPLPAEPAPISGQVGSERCPPAEAIRGWVDTLANRVGPPLRGLPNRARVQAFHNAFVAYTVGMLLWALAIRPTIAGLRSLAPVAGRAVADEKSKGSHATRALPLAHVALRQWQMFKRHMDWLRRWCHAQGVECPQRNAGTSPWRVFNGRGALRELTLGRLRTLLDSPFEDNAQRHAMSTALLGAGWPAHRVNHWLNHASLGEESGATFNAAELVFTAQEMEDLARILAGQGWQLKEGMGNG